jgi:hypothetical protein
MNIFILSLSVIDCALFHCDQHVLKMILEAAELLCTACILTGGRAGYKEMFTKHQCTKWVLSSLSNWRWLKSLAFALNDEAKYRFNRSIDHASIKVINELVEPNIEDKGLTPFAQAMPEEFKDEDPILAYRKYYAGAKFRFATWKKREIPEWYVEMRKELGGDAKEEVRALMDPVLSRQRRQAAKAEKEQKKARKLLRTQKKTDKKLSKAEKPQRKSRNLSKPNVLTTAKPENPPLSSPNPPLKPSPSPSHHPATRLRSRSLRFSLSPQ